MSNGRTYVVPPATSITDEPTHCARVNVDWVPIVTGLLYRGNLYDYWQQTPDDIRRGKENIQTLIQMLQTPEGCEVADMKLRQRPDKACVLQQLQDDVWIDVFDYSKCHPAGLGAIITQPATIEEYVNSWKYYTSNDYETIYPELRQQQSVNIRALFCLALSFTTNMFTEIIAQVIEGKITEAQSSAEHAMVIAELALGALEVAAGVSEVAAASFPPAAIAVGVAALLGFVVRQIQAIGIQAEAALYRDQFRRERIACAWYTALFAGKGATYFPTYSDVIGSLYNALLVGDDASVRDNLLQTIQYEQIFAATLEYLDEIVASAGLFTFTCKCTHWRVTFDFTQAQYGWRQSNDWNSGAPEPQWQQGYGWRVPDLGSGYWENVLIKHLARFRLYRIAVTLSAPLLYPNSGLWFTPDAVRRFTFRRDIPGGLNYAAGNGTWIGWDLADEYECNGIQVGVTGDSVMAAFYNPLSQFLTHVTLYGVGFCPFQYAEEWDGSTW